MARPNTGRIDRLRARCMCGFPVAAHGVWKVRVTVPGTDRRLSRNVHGTKADAHAVLEHLLAERTVIASEPPRGVFDATNPTVAEVCAAWWPSKVATLSPNTAANWRPALDRHVLPALGHLPIKAVRKRDVGAMVAALRAKGLGAARIKTCTTVLSGVLAQAVEWEYRDDNPAYGYRVGGHTKSTVTAATVSEVVGLVNAGLRTNPDMAAIIVVAVDTGLRRNEIVALRWRDVDLDAGVMVCRHSVAKGGGGAAGMARGAVLRQTKTGVVAALTLSEGSVAALRAQYERQAAKCAGLDVDMSATYVFGIVPDRPMYPDTLSTRFAAVRSEAGLPHVQFRALRHSCATLLLTEGVDIRTVSGRLRHGRTSTTLDRYSDWVPAADAHAAATMDRLFAGVS